MDVSLEQPLLCQPAEEGRARGHGLTALVLFFVYLLVTSTFTASAHWLPNMKLSTAIVVEALTLCPALVGIGHMIMGLKLHRASAMPYCVLCGALCLAAVVIPLALEALLT